MDLGSRRDQFLPSFCDDGFKFLILHGLIHSIGGSFGFFCDGWIWWRESDYYVFSKWVREWLKPSRAGHNLGGQIKVGFESRRFFEDDPLSSRKKPNGSFSISDSAP